MLPRFVHLTGNTDRPPSLLEASISDGPQEPLSLSLEGPGGRVPAQVVPQESGSSSLVFVAPALKAAECQRFRVIPEEPTASGIPAVQIASGVDGRVVITLEGTDFTTYHAGHDVVRPYFHPLLGANGVRVTRSWPMDPEAPGEVRDHPHHKGLWVAHGDVNGSDNWSEEFGHGFIRQQRIEGLFSGDVEGGFTAFSTWVDRDETPLVKERRVIRVFSLPGGIRALDLSVTLHAESDVVFGDTKEGGICSVRVTTSMTEPNGGRIEDGDGRVSEKEAWGHRSAWCDYSGEVSGEKMGIAVLNHPESFRFPTFWHVRGYGLMTANPFGEAAFTGKPSRNGQHLLRAGESIRFLYRVLVHPGNASDADIAGQFESWSRPPQVVLE